MQYASVCRGEHENAGTLRDFFVVELHWAEELWNRNERPYPPRLVVTRTPAVTTGPGTAMACMR